MIYELPRAAFARAAPLFAEAWMDRAFIAGALDGGQAARLFADDPDRPTAALLCRSFGYYVAGDPGCGELRRFIADAPAEVGVFGALYGYVPTNVPLARALLADHGERLVVVARRGLRLDSAGTAPAPDEPPPSGAILRPLDRALAERVDRELGQTIALFWDGYDPFLADGFGTCAFVGGQLASVAFAAAVGGGEANIDVATAPPFRRRGLAAGVCAAFVTQCRARDLVPTWDCDADNVASAALARRLGFREDHPFSQLSPPGYAKLAESRGRWQPGPAHGDIATWRRIEEAR